MPVRALMAMICLYAFVAKTGQTAQSGHTAAVSRQSNPSRINAVAPPVPTVEVDEYGFFDFDTSAVLAACDKAEVMQRIPFLLCNRTHENR